MTFNAYLSGWVYKGRKYFSISYWKFVSNFGRFVKGCCDTMNLLYTNHLIDGISNRPQGPLVIAIYESEVR